MQVSIEALPGAAAMQSQPCLWMQMHGPDGSTQPLPFHSTQGGLSEAFDCSAEAVGPLTHLTGLARAFAGYFKLSPTMPSPDCSCLLCCVRTWSQLQGSCLSFEVRETSCVHRHASGVIWCHTEHAKPCLVGECRYGTHKCVDSNTHSLASSQYPLAYTQIV